MFFTKKLINTSFACVFFLFLGLFGNSQKLQITGSSGGSIYEGDLAAGFIPTPKLALSAGLTYDLSTRFRIRDNFTYCSVWGDDKNSPKVGVKNRSLNFKTDIIEIALMAEYDLRNSDFNNLIPYVFVGPSVYHFDPTTNWGGKQVHTSIRGTEGQLFSSDKYTSRKYNLTQLNLQYGLGIRTSITPKITFGFEASWRKLFTDYLDDVSSKSYISASEWQAEINKANASGDSKKAQLLQQGEALSWRYVDDKGNTIPIPQNPDSQGTGYPRGNPNKNDAYYTFQTRLSITLFGGGDGYSSTLDLYSPRSPYGRGQLRCPKKVY